MKQRKRWWIVGVVLGALLLAGSMDVRAQTLEERVQKLEKEVGQGIPEWVHKFTFSGDLRLRYQHDDREGDPDRNRGRYRARFAVSVQVVEQIKAILGIASGGDDPRSTNQTFNDTFSSKDIRFDLAYAEYTPVEWAKILGGKMKNPLWTPSQLLWDSDIRPEGGAGVLQYKFGPTLAAFFTVAGWVIDEDSTGQVPFMVPLQGGIDAKLANRFGVKLALSYYIFSDVKDNELDFSAGTNTRKANGRLRYNYDAFSVGGEVGMDLKLFGGLLPYAGVFGDYVVNPDPSDNNQGYLIGVLVGHKSVKTAGQWQFVYDYRRLERDAWLDTFPDSDFYGGATNAEGYKISASVGVYKRVSLGVNYYHAEQIKGSNDHWDVVQFDVLMKF